MPPTGKFTGSLPPPSLAAIRKVEASLGFPIPKQLRELLAVAHGGQPTRQTLLFREGANQYRMIEFRNLYTVGGPDPGSDLAWTYETLVRERGDLRPSLLPFGDNEGGDEFCIEVDSGRIFFWEHEFPRESLVSENLEAFFAGMLTDEEAEQDPRWTGEPRVSAAKAPTKKPAARKPAPTKKSAARKPARQAKTVKKTTPKSAAAKKRKRPGA